MSTGLRWEEVAAEWDLPLLARYSKYWKQHPPAHVCLKILAMERRLPADEEDAGSSGEASQNIGELLAMTPKGAFPRPTGRMVDNDGKPV